MGLGLWGCGTLGDGIPPQDLWPRTPLRGFVLRNAETPLFVEKAGFDLDRPSQEPVSHKVTVFGQIAPRNQPQNMSLFSATRQSLDDPGPPDTTYGPLHGWEGSSLHDPVWLPPAGSGHFAQPLLFYGTQTGAIGLGGRAENGVLWRAQQPLVDAVALGGDGRVSPVVLQDALRLYFVDRSFAVRFAQVPLGEVERFLENGVPIPPALFAVSGALVDAAEFSLTVARNQQAPAKRLEALFVRQVVTPAGRVRLDLYARAVADDKAALVAASSYVSGSGQADRFLPVPAAEPLLLETSGGLVGGCSVADSGGQPLLWLGLKTVQSGVAVAVPSGVAP